MERTYAPGQGNGVFCASWFMTTFGKHLKAFGKHFHSIWKHFGKHFGSISEAFGLKSAFWKNALEKIRGCAVVKKSRFYLCSVVLATTFGELLEALGKLLEAYC